jgi:putative transposase
VKVALRDEVVAFVDGWSERTGLSVKRLLTWLEITPGKSHAWQARWGLANRHHGAEPREFWLLAWERAVIVTFAQAHPLNGYRRLAYMMLDADVVAVSPSSVYRVLKEAGWLQRARTTPSTKGNGFVPPAAPHAHWHVDISYLNIAGTFYYLCAVLDGYSRFIVHWEIREQMQESDIEIILQRAHEQVPTARPRIISDNGPQFIAKELKTFIRLMGMTHVRTSPFYPQSNGKLERWHPSLKRECIRPKSPVSLGDARQLVAAYVTDDNTVRLHGAIGYITPQDQLLGRVETIFAARRRKLAAAAARRAAAQEHPDAAAA